MKPVDDALGQFCSTISSSRFAAKESKSFSWKLTVPDGLGPLVVQGGRFDGPRFRRRRRACCPCCRAACWSRNRWRCRSATPARRQFDFVKLRQSAGSKTLKNESLTVQMVSNPSWYAVMALPYLMESPYECSEQVFNRLYANSLARHIAASDPKIRRIFDQWKGTPALDSPLEKNQDLKSVMIEETPWLRQAEQGEPRRAATSAFCSTTTA